MNSALAAQQLPLDIAAIRQMMDEVSAAAPGGPYISTRAEDLSVPESHARLRVVRPHGAPTGVVVVVHGGGWSFGAARDHDQNIEDLVDELGVVGVAIDYRLAPENPYPYPLDDVTDAIRFVLTEPAVLFDEPGSNDNGKHPLVVTAESAGANLALSAVLELRNSGERLPDGMNLLYGAYDLSMTPSQIGFGTSGLVNSRTLPYFYSLYAGARDVRDTAISPLYARLDGLPKCLLTVGTDDPLTDDSLFMYARMTAAGVNAELHLAPGGAHGFNHFPTRIASESTARSYDLIRSILTESRS
ncbi:alpha/beta hydrolase [Rhodococcus koreensis]